MREAGKGGEGMRDNAPRRVCIEEMADFLAANREALLAPAPDTALYAKTGELLRACRESLLAGALLARQEGDLQKAERYLSFWVDYAKRYVGRIATEGLRYLAQVRLAGGKWAEAAELFQLILERQMENEEACFYLAAARLGMGAPADACALYEAAVARKRIFPEAQRNLDYVRAGGREADSLPCRTSYEISLAIDPADYLDLPIFINSRDRLACLARLMDWLTRAGCRRIYILDNESTYEPLLCYYAELERTGRAKVRFLGRNCGHTALWDSGILEELAIATPYVYTDSDVVPTEDCPPDAVGHFLRILQRYPFLDKVGFALRIDDITMPYADACRAWEERFYFYPLEKDCFFAPVDTTFALYQNRRHYTILTAARTTGRYIARHLPWYGSARDRTEDERYYLAHASKSSSLAEAERGHAEALYAADSFDTGFY